MKTVLIVEDEKLIRQGIKTMIQRSGVPIDVIMESSNGETALEIVKQQDIDVMFTDVRMPKMDGIELVRRIREQDLKQPPYIVVISGYDDFFYAVEMLRNGVREYILKPVEREKIIQILMKLNEEIKQREERNRTDRKIGNQQIKYLLTVKNVQEEEIALLEQKYEEHFFRDGYVVCVYDKQTDVEENEDVIRLTDLEYGDVCIIEKKRQEELLSTELNHSCVGISRIHYGLHELKGAYTEAFDARKRAFCMQKATVYATEEQPQVPEALRQQAAKLLGEQVRMQRVQLIGTDKTEELIEQWNRLFEEAKKQHILPDELCEAIESFLDETGKIYRNTITEKDMEVMLQYRYIFAYTDIAEYETYFMDWVLELHNRINSQLDNNRNQQKIKQAVDYIKENYNKDLNMAVVSNYISMNYSLFSFLFKQYVGQNFVGYLKETRIAEAKKLLEYTDMKVVEISQAVGYDNEKHFMKIFKSVCGVSPSEYRKNMTQ